MGTRVRRRRHRRVGSLCGTTLVTRRVARIGAAGGAVVLVPRQATLARSTIWRRRRWHAYAVSRVDVAPDRAALRGVGGVVGAVQREVAQAAELRHDAVQPAGVEMARLRVRRGWRRLARRRRPRAERPHRRDRACPTKVPPRSPETATRRPGRVGLSSRPRVWSVGPQWRRTPPAASGVSGELAADCVERGGTDARRLVRP